MMACGECNKSLDKCTCPDIDKRIAVLRNDNHYIYKMCRICEKHYARCKCPEPFWTTSIDGIEFCPICQKPIVQEDYAITHTSETFCPKEYLGYMLHLDCAKSKKISVDPVATKAIMRGGEC